MSKEKLVRKILKSFPKKFDMKVKTIGEAQDICNMKVDELIGSLQTFELAISERSEKKNKSITFICNTDNEEAQCDMENDEGISKSIMLLGRQFSKVLKKWIGSQNQKSRTYHTTSVRTMTFREKQEHMRRQIKEKVFRVIHIWVWSH